MEKIKMTEIKFGFSENRRLENKTFNNWTDADMLVASVAPTVKLGYDKTDFSVTFADGFTYNGRLDVCEKEDKSVSEHMIDTLKFYAGLHKPYHLTDEQYNECIGTLEDRQNAREILEQYEIG